MNRKTFMKTLLKSKSARPNFFALPKWSLKLLSKKLLPTALIFNLSICCLFLAGCGFTLRTQNSLPPQLHNVYLQADNPYGQLEIAIKRELQASGVVMQESVNAAPFILHLAATSFTQTSDTSNSPSTQARIYHLSLSASFSLLDAKGITVLAPQTVAFAQDLTLNANEIFDTSTQVDITKQNMQRALIIKIFNMLCSKQTFDSLAHANAATPPQVNK